MKNLSQTINLPNTSFSMRANLSKNEPKWIQLWKQLDIVNKIKEINKGKKPFILHDGPPYANGNLHLGHALNKILKDIINRFHFKLGFDVDYIPGWDCHGLPIEWKIEEKYKKAGKDKNKISNLKFRAECRDFAKSWIEIQSKEFERLGINCDWKKIYTTMAKDSEGIIVAELLKCFEEGRLYLGNKPVMWSVVEQTALAEAEVEYKDKRSKSIYVKFPVKDFPDTNIIIWTTTPWTLPGNRAIAFDKNIIYQKVVFKNNYEKFNISKGEKILFSKKLFKSFSEFNGLEKFEIEKEFEGKNLEGLNCYHPLKDLGFNFDVPLLSGDHVTEDAGSGFVHIAPGHGIEDFELGKKNNISPPKIVADGGIYYDEVPFFSGVHIFKADNLVVEELEKKKMLIASNDFSHSYPHSWRSKAPLIYRTTSQWFISMTEKNLRATALDSIENVKWYPPSSKNRIKSMIEDRPDWCVSRQRSWGVPITIILDKKNNRPLVDTEINKKIIKLIKENGTDIWFMKPVDFFLTNKYNPENYEKVEDILDVWFDSGSSHAFVLKQRGINEKADLYLEGSDQHRGWFQSSLLQSCANYGDSPYKSVLTHGFVLDSSGKKMSKSLGNVISPNDVISKYGADILRLWVATTNYNEDLRISYESLDRQTETYRKIRNSLRFLLGNLKDWNDKEKIQHSNLPELEKYIRARLFEINTNFIKSLKTYNFYNVYQIVSNFCNNELSSLFFDIRKDTLYCDHKDSLKRNSARTVMVDVFKTLINWLSPVLVFTSEEAWQTWKDEIDNRAIQSCHFELYEKLPSEWEDKDLITKWDEIIKIKKAVNNAIETKRNEKLIKTSLECEVSIYFNKKEYFQILEDLDLNDFFITSKTKISQKKEEDFVCFEEDKNIYVKVEKINGKKCDRCWKFFDELNKNLICNRCDEAIKIS